RYPPLPEQRAIARILNTLDDKIELNRRMNKTLEEMTQVLFDHLFPYSTDDNLPDGWRVGRLDEVVFLQRGFDLPTPERLPGPYPIVAASGPSGTHNQFMVRGPGVTTGRSGVLGNVYFVHEDFWPLNTSLWVKEFRHATPAYAYHLLLGLDFELFNAGSAVPTLNRNHVHNLPVAIPPMQRVQEFDRTAMMLLKRQKSNHEESKILAALRDAQLPKLMSGEVRVKL
ncbi:MAG TPA: restriction endonuclease subunit S, partial [Pyrinomonadaceae bacterium]